MIPDENVVKSVCVRECVRVAQEFLGSYFRHRLTPFIISHLGSFLLLKKSSFSSKSGVKITPKMRLFLLLTWVVFTLFGVYLTLKVE